MALEPEIVRRLAAQVPCEANAAISTWFRIGGRAEALARPETPEQLAACLHADPGFRVLGDGANLLVDDAGVGGLVVSLQQGDFVRTTIDARARLVRAGAGCALPKLITACVRAGLGGLESLAGIPATLGGAAVMNAGGAFGEIAQLISAVHALTRSGELVTLPRERIAYAYRTSGLHDLIVTGVDLALTPSDPAQLEKRLREVMAYKTASQPMSARSAGCAFRNPTLAQELLIAGERIGGAGQRVSAGLLIDRAGCKGLRVGGAFVSDVHANFIATDTGARARDVIALMDAVRQRVLERFGVALEREVVVWEGGR